MIEKQRIFSNAFNKYLDEITVEEWELMINASCDDPLRKCDNILVNVNESQKNQ